MSRTRINDQLNLSSYNVTDYSPIGAVQSVTTVASNRKASGKYWKMSDTNFPRFFARRRNGEILINDMDTQIQDRSCILTDATIGPHPSWGRRVFSGSCACEWSQSGSLPSWKVNDRAAIINHTLERAHAKMNESDFSGLINLMQWRQTLGLIPSVAGQLTSVFDEISKSRKVARAWATYRWGIKPLLSDVDDLCNVIASVQRVSSVRKVMRGNARDQYSNLSRYTPIVAGIDSCTMERAFSSEWQCHTGVIFEVFTSFDSLPSRLGFRLRDIPAALWDAVPYSFVLDWSGKVGQWLDATVPSSDVRLLGSWATTDELVSQRHSVIEMSKFIGTAPATTYTTSGGVYTENIRYIHRTANPALSSTPSFEIPKMDLTRAMDAWSLLTQALTKCRH